MNGITPGSLSPREKQVVRYYMAGLTDKEIAIRLGVSYQTVKSYGVQIRNKLDAANRAQAVSITLTKNLLT